MIGRTVRYLMSVPVLWYLGSRKFNFLRGAELGSNVTIGVSRKSIAHLGQLNTHDYQKFISANGKRDIYEIQNINVQRLTLIYAKCDRIVDIADGKYFRDKLIMENVIWDPVMDDNCDHFDLILGMDTTNTVNSKILKSLI